MRRATHGLPMGGIAAVLALFGLVAQAKAEPERVRFNTADYVEIQGQFYPGKEGAKSATVLMLHPLGASVEEAAAWGDLAKKLNEEKGFAVLTFDFRGHGNSTNVQPQFWLDKNNQSLKGYRGPKSKTTISYQDFKTAANVLTMENDIVAAKRYLDTKNDGGECNSAKIIVLGAGSGATLGAAWINSEWNRRVVKTGFPVVANPYPEGHDIIGAIWLSMTPSAGSGTAHWTAHLDRYLGSPVRDNVPMMFIYGEQDAANARLAKSLHNSMSKSIKDKKTKDLMQEVGLKDTKLAGVGLLGKPSLETEKKILAYASLVAVERASNPWGKKEVEKAPFTPFPVSKYVSP
jgi:hypothetical protein